MMTSQPGGGEQQWREDLPSARLAAVIVLTGIGAGLGGGALTLLLHLVQHLAYGYSEDTFLIGVQRAAGQRRVLVMAAAGVIAGGGWWSLRRFAAPVPKVAQALGNRDVRMTLGTVTLDAVLQIVVVGLGASLGREGAPRQFGGAVGAWLAERAGLPADQRRILLACGAGAGLTAAYNVPVGGALFTAEVLLASLAFRVVVPAAATSVIATVVAWAVVSNRPTYQVASPSLSATVVAWAVLAGPLLGLAGTGFVRLLDYAERHRADGARLPIATVLVFPALGALAIAYPQLLGNGKGPAQLAFDGTPALALLAALIVLKPIATAACLASGATGGRLTPAVATGALLGALLGRAWMPLWPGARIGELAIIGAAGFLAVTLNAPLTAIALLLEFTHTGTALFVPMVLTVAGAVITARALRNRSISRASSGAPAPPPPG